MLEYRYDYLSVLRHALGYVVEPLLFVANAPLSVSNKIDEHFTTLTELKSDKIKLEQELLLIGRRLQKLSALTAENKRLRSLLKSSKEVKEKAVIAQIIGVDSDPYRHEIILDQGLREGIKVGQAILDENGLMGQITAVGPLVSRALLISDVEHAIPVQVNRNGVRAIAVGGGYLNKLKLIHVPDTTDLLIGDLLVSSGLGGVFPAGYPVAEISYIEHDPGLPFAIIEAKPKSRLDRRRHVLIVMKGGG